MNNRLRAILILLGGMMVAATFTFPLWSPLFRQEVVDETFPGLDETQQTAFDGLQPDVQAAYNAMLRSNPAMAMEMVKAATAPDLVVPESEQAMPQMTNPMIAVSGTFIEIDLLHRGSGKATIYQLPDNRKLLRLEDFRVTNGPSLNVYLTRNPDPRTAVEVGNDYIDLGPLKGNVGNQNYPVPTEADLTVYRGVVIYCVPFGVVFSTASLR